MIENPGAFKPGYEIVYSDDLALTRLTRSPTLPRPERRGLKSEPRLFNTHEPVTVHEYRHSCRGVEGSTLSSGGFIISLKERGKMICICVLKKGGRGVCSPVDGL